MRDNGVAVVHFGRALEGGQEHEDSVVRVDPEGVLAGSGSLEVPFEKLGRVKVGSI